MAGDRTLKLSLLADTKNLVDGLNKGSKATDSFGKQIGNISAKVVKSFALIGGAIAGVSLAFAKAAAQDQQSANKLTQTIGSVTNATQKQIQAVQQYITATSLATGITDDELRPAFERLVRSTKDVEQSQKLLNLALDLSAATGKPLEAVTNALAKAYDGSYTSLGRLGLGIDAATLKTKDFNAITESLNRTYGEFSENRSREAIVKFERLQVAIQEAKEAVGAALLPVFERLGDWLLRDGVPRLNAFIAGLTGDRSLSSSFTQAQKDAEAFGGKLRNVFDAFVKYKDLLIQVAAVAGTVFVVSKIAAGVQATITAIRALITAYNALKASSIVAGIAGAFALNPALGVGAAAAAPLLLAAAAKIAGTFDTDLPGDFNNNSTGTIGNYQMSSNSMLSNATAPSMTFPTYIPTPTGGGGGGGGGGGSTGGGSTNRFGFSSAVMSNQLVQDLIATSDEIALITRQLNSGKISPYQAQQRLNAAQSRFADLQAQAQAAGAIAAPGASIQGGVGRGEYGGITINVNAPSIIDETGFSRAVQQAIQNSERRGAYAGGL